MYSRPVDKCSFLQNTHNATQATFFSSGFPHVTGHVSSQDVDLALKPPKEVEVSLLSLPESRRGCLDFCTRTSRDSSFLLLPDFLGLAVSFLLLASGCSLPFIYLVPYALSNGLSQQNAAFLMSILGVTGIVGNITFGWLTDRKYEAVLFMGSPWLIFKPVRRLKCTAATGFLSDNIVFLPPLGI